MTTPELRVEDTLAQYRDEQTGGPTRADRDHVVVALAGGPEAATLLSRGARLAARADGRLDAVHVVQPGHDDDLPPATIAKLRALTEDAGGTLHAVVAEDPAEAVLDLARGVHATTIVVGVSRSTRWTAPFRSGVSDRIVTGSGDIDVLMVTHPYARAARLTGPRIAGHPLGRGRLITGWVLALTAPLLLTLALLPLRGSRTPAFEALAFIAVTVLCALAGGLWPALTAGLVSSLLLNFFFTPPVHTLGIANVEDLVALLLFLLVAVAVASVVGAAARRAVQADLARRESDTLSLLNQTLLRGDHDLTRAARPGPGHVRDGPRRPSWLVPKRRRPVDVVDDAGQQRSRPTRHPRTGRRQRGGLHHRPARPARPAAARTRHPRPVRVRHPPRRGGRPGAARRPDRRRPTPRGGQPAAHRTAGGRLPRPAHPAGRDQGRRLHPAHPRRHVEP